MVTKWGLSDEMGPIAYGEQDEEVFLGRSVTQTKNVSDDTARKIDEVVRSILDRAYNKTKAILQSNLGKLHMMAEALLLYETIDVTQIDAVMEGRRPGPPADWAKTGRTGKDDIGPATGPIGGPAPQV
jgi:cell division protease FtsH